MKTQTPTLPAGTNYAINCMIIKLSCKYNIAQKKQQCLVTIGELIQDPWFLLFIEASSAALRILESEGVIYISPNGNIFPGINFIPLED